MAAEDCQDDDDLFDFRDSDDDDVEEGNVVSVNGSAVSHSETAEAPSIHGSPVVAESPVINITSSPVATEQVTIARVVEEQEHFPLPNA
jgi:hypothetical protein